MNKKDKLKLDLLSNIKDEIIDKQSEKRYKLMTRKRRRFPKWIIPTGAAAAIFIAALIPILILLFSKQVPIYEGMTVLENFDGSTAKAAPSYRIDMLTSTDNNGNHYGHDKKPISDIVEEDPTISLTVPEQQMYYADPDQDIYINIHISNPDNFVILSFMLNGKTYSSYMFEEGSDMENIVLKVNVGDVAGVVEYTIDAIKYVDGTQIKDVIMEGDRTVKVGVYSEGIQPEASITNELVGINEISFTASLSDKYNLIERSGGKAYAILFGEDNIIAYKELTAEETKIVFNGLDTSTSYRYGIVAYYDSLDGNGLSAQVMLEKEFTTQSVVAIEGVNVDQTGIDFGVIFNEAFESKALSSMTLYHGEEKVKEFDVSGDITQSTFSASELLSNNTYRLVLTYENLGQTETVEFELTTEAKATPKIEITTPTKTQTSVGFEITETDTDNVGAVTKIELVHANGTIEAKNLEAREFADLLSNNEYTVKVTYTYDLNDGIGEQTIVKELAITTEAKATPEIEITTPTKTQTSVGFEITETDTDNVGAVTKIELVHANGTIEAKSLEAREFADLLSNNEYTVKITYTYDLNDGIGEQTIVKELAITTEAKAKPDVKITENSKTQTSIKFDVAVADVDSVGEITKLELIHGEDVQNITDLDTREFTDLLSNNKYTVKITYTYDLNDGIGEQTIVKELAITTEAKAIPTVSFSNMVSTQYTVSGQYSITDSDGALKEYKAEFYHKDDFLSKIEGNKVDFKELDYYTDYTVKITFSFDLNDGLGAQTKITEYTIKTQPYLKVNTVTVRNTGGIIEGDTIYLQTILDNPLSAEIISLVVNGKTYNVSSILSETNVFVEITNDGQFDGGETELFVECVNIKLDGVNYKMTFEDPCSDKVFINGKVKLISIAFVNKDLDPVYWGMPDDEVYLLFTVDNPTGYDIKKINLSAFGCSFDNDTDGFEGEVDLSKITVIDDDHFYIPINTSENCSAVIHSVFLTYGNEHVSSLTVDSTNKNDCESFDPIPYYKLATNEIRYVSTAEDLMAIESGYYYEMTCDIDLSDISVWSGIEEFSGVFNGNGYSIKNASMVASNTDAGIFKKFVRGVIENVKLENLLYMITSTESENEKWYSVGGLVGKCESGEFPVIRNCTLDESSIIKCVGFDTNKHYGGGYVGGICGNGCRMIDCISYGTIDAQATYVGGIIGEGAAHSCENYGMLTVYRGYGIGYFGGISGYGTALNCSNYGNIYVQSIDTSVGNRAFVGGICGTSGEVKLCANHGDIVQSEKKAYAGGIVGGGGGGTIEDCINYGNIFGGCGIVGYRSGSGKLYIKNCINVGSISGYNAGGISYIGGSSGLEVSIEGCVNAGKITGSGCGGIIKGKDSFDGISVWNCYTDIQYPSDSYYSGVAQCSIEQLFSKEFYTETLGWSEDVWDFSELDVINGKYPGLKG